MTFVHTFCWLGKKHYIPYNSFIEYTFKNKNKHIYIVYVYWRRLLITYETRIFGIDDIFISSSNLIYKITLYSIQV